MPDVWCIIYVELYLHYQEGIDMGPVKTKKKRKKILFQKFLLRFNLYIIQFELSCVNQEGTRFFFI